MKIKNLIPALLLCCSLLSAAVSQAFGKDSDQKNLQTLAKITEAQAREIALKKVPGGKIESGELEEEKGLLIWSFDITKAGTKDITEVAVDAKTGAVVSVDIENPKVQQKEKEADKKEHEKQEQKAKKEKDGDDEKDDKK